MTITKTRILCANNAFHAITHDDTTGATTTACPAAEEHAARFAALIRLGHQPTEVPGCTAFLALLRHGLPALVAADLDADIADPPTSRSSWESLYVRFETNSVVVAERERLVAEARRHVSAENELAFQALRKTRYRSDFAVAELREETCFRRPEKLVGHVVAYYREDGWCVPLQVGWTENVHAAGVSVVDGKFVVGLDIDCPGFVYAIDVVEDTARYEVQRFALINGQLGKVAA